MSVRPIDYDSSNLLSILTQASQRIPQDHALKSVSCVLDFLDKSFTASASPTPSTLLATTRLCFEEAVQQSRDIGSFIGPLTIVVRHESSVGGIHEVSATGKIALTTLSTTHTVDWIFTPSGTNVLSTKPVSRPDTPLLSPSWGK